MSAPVSREKEPETGTRDKPRQAPVPRISTREIRLEESWCCFSLSGSENHCRPGSGGPFPVGLARIFSGWQRTSHLVVVVAVVVSSPGLALPPGPGYARWQVTRFPRPGRSLLTPGAGPGRAARTSLGSSLSLRCPRVPELIPVSPCVCLYLRTGIRR